jgi:hypothetical protein
MLRLPIAALALAILLLPVMALPAAGTQTATQSSTPSVNLANEECSSGGGIAGPELPAGSQSISGIVTGAGGAGGLGGIEVRIWGDGVLQSLTTEDNGTYAVTGIGGGPYVIDFFDWSGSYQSGFYSVGGLVIARDDASDVTLSGSGAVADVELPAELGLGISGAVTNHMNATVADIRLDVESAYSFFLPGCATSASDGTYAMTELRAGVYRIAVTDPNGYYPSGFYSDVAPGGFVTSRANATLVNVDGGDLTGIDVQFPELFTLSGSVQTSGFDPVEGAQASACLTGDEYCAYGSTDEFGVYSITPLVVGDYTIQLSAGGLGYLNGYYGPPDGFTLNSVDATVVSVTANVTDIDLLAVPAPTVSGTVTNLLAGGLSEIAIYLNDPVTGESGDAVSGLAGVYETTAVQPGSYQIWVSDPTGTYPSGFLDASGLITADAAEAVLVPIGTDNVSGIDIEIPDGGGVQIAVLQGGQPAPFAYTNLCFDEFDCAADAGADDFGLAVYPAMLPGTYFARATTDFETNYWYVAGDDPSPDFALATLVEVVAGSTVAIELDLPAAGSLTPAGEDVEVPLDDGTGATPVVLTFDTVEGEGTTSLTIPEAPPSLPSGFQYGDPASYFEIETTATFDGLVTVCVTFDPAAYTDPASVRLLHFIPDPDPGSWVDVTVLPVDAINGIACGRTDSFSPFVLVEPQFAFAGFFGTKAAPHMNAAKPGDVIGIQFLLEGNEGTDFFANGSPTTQAINCSTGAPLGPSSIAETGSGVKFNVQTQRYTVEWKTSKSWKKSCHALTLTFKDGSTAEVWFSFK